MRWAEWQQANPPAYIGGPMECNRQCVQGWSAASQTTNLAMDFTRQKALAKKNVGFLFSGWRQCLSLLLPVEGGKHSACVRCGQVGDVLRTVAELKGEVKEHQGVWALHRLVDWLPAIHVRKELGWYPSNSGGSFCCCQAKGGDLRDEKEWKQVSAQCCRQIPCLPTSFPRFEKLHNRFEALEFEGKVSENVVGDPPRRLSRVRQSTPCLRMASSKKERRVTVVGYSLLRGAEGPIPIAKCAAFLGPRAEALLKNFMV